MTVYIPSESTPVGHIRNHIKCNSKDVSALLSSVCLDENVNRMINEFERAVAFLLPTDPVKNKKNRVHDRVYYVSAPSTDGKDKGREKGKWVNKALFKPRTGKTGVELRYYKSDEFSELTQEQQDELQDHRN